MVKRMIDSAIFDDPDYQALSGDAQKLYLYLNYNHRTELCGCYTISDMTVAIYAKLEITDLPAMYGELTTMNVERKGHWVWLQRYSKEQNWSNSPTFLRGVATSIEKIDDKELRDRVREYNSKILGGMYKTKQRTVDKSTGEILPDVREEQPLSNYY